MEVGGAMVRLDVDAVIVGGGIAGLQAAIQLGRYMRHTAVIDGGAARSRWCRKYSNLLGWPDGVSGEQLRSTGRAQAEKLGVTFIEDMAVSAEKQEGKFVISLHNRPDQISGSVMLLSTGVLDQFPLIEGLERCLGMSIYVCSDCDGYEALNRRTAVLGSGNAGARMALAVSYWTNQIIYVNHDKRSVDQSLIDELNRKSIAIKEEHIVAVEADKNGFIHAIRLFTGERIEAERGFIAFGGHEVHTDLAKQLGAERMESGHLLTDSRTRMTSVDGLWAAGDIGVHSQLVTAAMAEGSISAIWMHKWLLQKGIKRTYNGLITVQG